MSKLETLRDGLIDNLKDLFSAENQLLKALPKMEKKASDAKLKEAFSSHLEETKGQIERLQKIATLMDEKPSGKTCKAMQGLIEEGKEVIEEESENEALLDALLIGAAQRVEHYEISAYGTACAMAKELGETQVLQLLTASLQEESAADKKLTAIAERNILREANSFEEEEEDDSERLRSKKNGKRSSAMQQMAVIGAIGVAAFCPLNVQAENRPEAVKSQRETSTGITSQNAREVDAERKVANERMHRSTDPSMQTESRHNSVNTEREAAAYEADNTGRNARDVNAGRQTADQQMLGGTELNVLAQIRRNVVAKDGLSTNAKNVKIMVENGTVTLRGPVKNAEEKKWIEEEAARTAQGYTVVNQLEVAPG